MHTLKSFQKGQFSFVSKLVSTCQMSVQQFSKKLPRRLPTMAKGCGQMSWADRCLNAYAGVSCWCFISHHMLRQWPVTERIHAMLAQEQVLHVWLQGFKDRADNGWGCAWEEQCGDFANLVMNQVQTLQGPKLLAHSSPCWNQSQGWALCHVCALSVV